jgi:hypothetical protein
MTTKRRLRRTAASTAAGVALLASGAGIAAVASGAIAVGGSGGAAIVTHPPGKLTLSLTSDETRRAAYKAGDAASICGNDVWLRDANATQCTATVLACAKQGAADNIAVLVTMTRSGSPIACEPA